jgi:hypothetical protein
MELTIKGTPDEIKNVLQAISGSKEHGTKKIHSEIGPIVVDEKSARKSVNLLRQNLEMIARHF